MKLFDDILAQGGLIISEYEPDAIAWPGQFHDRNRIISGISLAVLVIEAAPKSGTQITVDYAKEQNKPIFACPGRLDRVTGEGVNNMIIDGAKVAINTERIVKELSSIYPNILPQDNKTITKFKNGENRQNYGLENNNTGTEELLLNLLDSVKSIEELEFITGLTRIDLLKTLIELEADGFIEQIAGSGYRKILID